ncbi:MAG: hypothetical protein MUC36_26090 [Planctomycetes bacterium]|jgi:hypothetical protein|nr:hypothetical protein [Planctomycetota bacterium]
MKGRHHLGWLLAMALAAIRNPELFSVGWGTAEIVRGDDPKPTGELPFAEDAEAITFLRDWIHTHFGPLPMDTELVVDRVLRSASGGDQPMYDWDQGHTVVFTQTWCGVRTDRHCVLYLQGRSKVTGSLALGRFTPIAGTEQPVLDDAAARSRIIEVLRAIGQADGDPDRVARNLRYIVSDIKEDSADLRPVWMLGEGPFLLDAHTGQPGRNG